MVQKTAMVKSKIFFTLSLVFAVCCLMTTSSWAARKVNITSANTNRFIGPLNQNGAALGPVFGLSAEEGFQLLRQRTDFNGVTHYRYQQTYKGIPVWGMQTIISKGRSNKVKTLHGSFVKGSPGDVGSIPAKLDPQGALRERQEVHKKNNPGPIWNSRNEQYGTFIYLDKKDKAHLCYVVSFFADTDRGNPTQPIFFIDAKNGKVLDSYDMLRYQGVGPGGNLKIGYYYYGTDYPPFCVGEDDITCVMDCPDVKTVDLNHGTSGSTPFSFTCYENTHEEINGAYCPLNDAQYFGQVVFDTYMDWYGVAVLPFQLTLRCHYSTDYENAFWDGSTITFGDGYTTFYPLVSLDVVAHEVSHGFTEHNSGLIYAGQSGGINESFSDAAGEACEYYMRDSNDFMCGYDIFKDPDGALRYLYDPPLDGYSIDHVDDYYEGMDVHYSCGIFNKAFYLIASSSGWNTRMVFDIFVKANQDYWIPDSTFVQGAEAVMDAAVDYGYSCQDVVDAFAVVGINLVCPGPPVADFSASPVSSGVPLTTHFTDLSQAVSSWLWNFGDSGTSTEKNPTHTYTVMGTYTVTLTATNEFGSDTEVKTNYITVTAPQPPIADFIASSTDINVGNSVTFTDQSLENPASWSWTFEGGTPATSTVQNPTVTYNAVGTFNVTLVVTNAQGSDTETKIDYITVSLKPYCASSGSEQGYEYIAGVAVGDLNNASGPSPYSDFTSLFAFVTQGDTVNVSLTPGFPYGADYEYWKIWIDYNDDHDFEDAGEEVFSGYSDSILTGNFTVPMGTIIGNTRMRVSMSYDDWPSPCDWFYFGEVEDYTANISREVPTIIVMSPNGGENWQLGSFHNITWHTSDLSANLKLTLWKDGVQQGTIADNISPALGSYSWTVGRYIGGTARAGTGYAVKITEIGTAVSDMSDATFTLSPGITVTSPNGGESWPLGSIHNITWNAGGLSANLKLTLWKDGGLVGTIANNISPAPGSYSWTVGQYSGGTAPAGTGYAIKIEEIGTALSDMSNAPFTLAGITVTSPNGGESWQLGSFHLITWNAYGLSGKLNLTLWKNGVLRGTIADNIDPPLGSYLWTVGKYVGGTAAVGSGYTIKIKEIGTALADGSDGFFAISSPRLESWTFMVYLDGDNDLEGAGIEDFLEMSSIGSTEDVNIVVQFDRIAGYDSSYGDWSGTKRFFIAKGMAPTPANAVMDLGEANMGNPATLVNFVNWSKASFPAEKYALILWNHGGGWRARSKAELWRERLEKKKEKIIFKAVCWDDTNSGDCLYMDEVQRALNSSGGAGLIGFDACLMGMVEVAYEIRNYGQVMVGSEETEPWGGWPYNGILGDLTANPSWTPSQLGSAIVDDYYRAYGNDQTQSAINLTRMNTLANTISTFALTMTNYWNTNRTKVRNAAANVMTGINNTIINEQHGTEWPGAHGLAIYFPADGGSFNPDYNGSIIDFPKDTQWEEFLQKFYRSMGGSWIEGKRAVSQEFNYGSHIDLYHFCQWLTLVPGDYYTESQLAHEYVGDGRPQDFWDDDNYITYSLPFDFPYFGETIPAGTEIFISSNGYVDLSPDSDHWDYENSTAKLVGNKRIAPCWIDLITYGGAQAGEDVYITENNDNLVIRWAAEIWDLGAPVNVELVLFRDGRIQFNYNGGNEDLYSWNGPPTIGISKGDGLNYYLSVYNGQGTLTNVDSDLFTPISLIVTSPNGGEKWRLGSVHNITWDYANLSANIKITFWRNGALLGTIANSIDPAPRSYSWKVGQYIGAPGTTPVGSGYAIKIEEIGAAVSDMSDAAFSITN